MSDHSVKSAVPVQDVLPKTAPTPTDHADPQSGAINWQRVKYARHLIENNAYITEDRLDEAIDRLIEDINP